MSCFNPDEFLGRFTEAHALPKSIFFSSVNGKASDDFLVAYGDIDLASLYNRKQYAEIDTYYKHPNFYGGPNANRNDIALIRLKSPLNFQTTRVQPACLPVRDQSHYDGALRVRPTS